MAKATRAPARRVRKSARKTVPDQSNRKSATKPGGPKKRRLPNCVPVQRTYSRELLESGRHRYENTPELAATIAADFGIHPDSLHRLARRLEWVPYKMGPRELPAASRLLARVQQLEEAQASAEAPSEGGQESPLPRSGRGCPSHKRVYARLRRAMARAGEGVLLKCPHPARADALATLSRKREREAGAHGDDLATIIDQIEREVREELAKVSAMREQLKGMPPRPRDAQTNARTLSTLAETLEKLRRLRLGRPAPSGPAYDDMPADIDEFRAELARRIRAFVAARRGGGGAGGAGPAPALAQV
jgi:hypothetical protein